MAVKHKKKKSFTKKAQRGSVGSFFVFIVLIILIIAGIGVVGGFPSQIAPNSGQIVNIITPTTGATYSNLQLKTFGYVTLAPTPTLAQQVSTPGGGTTPVGTGLCQPGGVNFEPEIIAATQPASGQAVGATGQVKIWVMDEGAPMIAPGETTNADGSIATLGDQSAKALDNFLYEPALYLDTATAESGGSPHFPNYIKGQVNNNPSKPIMTTVLQAAVPNDALPAGAITTGCFAGDFFKCYTAEYIWNVSSLGLASGTHRAEFVIHDGDDNRGIGCINLQIQ